MYLLDTNACIRVLTNRAPSVAERLGTEDPRAVHLCSIVKAELYYGARHSERVSENLQLLERFFAPLGSLPFDDGCAEQYGLIRAELSRAGHLIGPNDLLIAACARAHDAVLVTHNTGEFSRVAGLRIDDWEA